MTTKSEILMALQSCKPKLSLYGVSALGLFGSHARNAARTSSDIDLLIDFEPGKENYDNYMAVYDLLESLFGNEKVEIVTKNGLSPYIGPAILNSVVYV